MVDGPVALVLASDGDRRNAMTVSFFSEVAHHPTSMWVSLERASLTHALVERTGQFSLAILHEKQAELALACGRVSGREHDKCAGLPLRLWPSGFLFLADSLTCTACRVRDSRPLGEHTLYIADLLFGERESRHTILRQLLLSDL